VIGRFVRISAIVFATCSALFWLVVSDVVQIVTVATSTGAGSDQSWLAQAIPMAAYGLACVLFCHWFARGVARRVQAAGVFE
jgi:hypothetical protein